MIVYNTEALTTQCRNQQDLTGLHYVVWDATRNPGAKWAHSPGINVGAKDSWGGTPVSGQFQGPNSYSAAGNVVGGGQGYYAGLESSPPGTSYDRWSATRFNPGSRKSDNSQGISRTAISVIAFDTRLHTAHPETFKYLTWASTTGSIHANGGAQAVQKTGINVWRVIWSTPFSNANYVVTGLANMRCTGGLHLAVADGAGAQTAAYTTLTSRTHDGTITDHGNACTFNTILAVGA